MTQQVLVNLDRLLELEARAYKDEVLITTEFESSFNLPWWRSGGCNKDVLPQRQNAFLDWVRGGEDE